MPFCSLDGVFVAWFGTGDIMMADGIHRMPDGVLWAELAFFSCDPGEVGRVADREADRPDRTPTLRFVFSDTAAIDAVIRSFEDLRDAVKAVSVAVNQGETDGQGV